MARSAMLALVAGLVCGATGSIFNYTAIPIDGGNPVNLAQYKGNVTIVVNVATYAGHPNPAHTLPHPPTLCQALACVMRRGLQRLCEPCCGEDGWWRTLVVPFCHCRYFVSHA